MLTLKNFLRCELEKQRVVLFYWLPVALASGIGCYLSLRHEPAPNLFVAMALLGGVFYLGYHFQTCSLAPFFLLLAVFCLGFFAVAGKAYYVAAPTLTYRFYGEIEGRIIGVDRARSGAVRVTLDQVELENISKSNTPQKVRLSINGGPAAQLLTPQGRLKTKGFLMPPPAPSEPGGFDFRRYAWFRGLGAVGYTREGVHITSGPSSGIFMRLFDRRMALSARIKAGVSEAASGPAAAIITGDRSSLTRAQLRDLRRSNLAHLLAISGLHVALLTGVVFGFFRRLCLLNANALLHFNAKKIAAGFAILIGFYYVMISGAAVSTQRAFIMVSIVMLGVFFDRRALSLHSVALAALVILAWRPEDVSSAGFQMSFAATIALVSVFQRIPALPRFSRLRRMPVISLILSSLVAGLATAPFSAAHFNQVSHYGLLANILSLPVMSFLVAPSAVLAMMLMPFGAEAVGLWGVDLGLRWILAVAHFFAQPASAVTFV
ncbi:MAG: ComEC/Rec2 family competence protein, partial [Paracoccaceae bacterium]